MLIKFIEMIFFIILKNKDSVYFLKNNAPNYLQIDLKITL